MTLLTGGCEGRDSGDRLPRYVTYRTHFGMLDEGGKAPASVVEGVGAVAFNVADLAVQVQPTLF